LDAGFADANIPTVLAFTTDTQFVFPMMCWN
jgi:hypothetical protein